jgi:hypothetical protein
MGRGYAANTASTARPEFPARGFVPPAAFFFAGVFIAVRSRVPLRRTD